MRSSEPKLIEVQALGPPEVVRQLGRPEPGLRAQRRQEFLLGLTDCLLSLAEPDTIVEAASAMIATFFKVARVGYGEFDEAQEFHAQAIVEREWSDGVAGCIVRQRRADFLGQPALEELRRGNTLAVEDTESDPRTAGQSPFNAHPLPGIRTFLAVPLLKQGHLAALLYLPHDAPRGWTAEDAGLAEDAARRVFAAVEAARVKAALRESEGRFRTLAETLPALVWIVDSELKLIYANARWTTFSGLPPHEALGFSWKASVHPDDVKRIVAQVERMRGHETAFNIEARYRSTDGVYRWHVVQAEPVRSMDGTLSAWVGASVDIHDRKEMEAALRESEERLSLAQRAAGIGTFDWDITSRRVTWTTEQEKVFNLKPGTFENTFEGWSSRVTPQTLEATKRSIDEAVARRDRELELAYTIRWPDGSLRQIEGRGTLFYAPDGSLARMVGVNIDITDRKDAEERQHLLIRELHHRVKNTLATVQAIAASTARTAPSIEDFHHGFVGRIVSLSHTHNLLTDDYWQKASLGELLQTELAPYRDAGHLIVLDGPAVELFSDAAVPIGMAIHELATNAVRHGALSRASGQVAVRWSVKGHDDRQMLHFAWMEKNGPPVVPPERQGFGSRLLRRVLAAQLEADVHIDYNPAGLHFSMTMPIPRRPASPAVTW